MPFFEFFNDNSIRDHPKRALMKILSYDYKILKTPGYALDKKARNYAGNEASIDHLNREIILDTDHPEHLQALLHELTHAADRYWYAGLTEQQIERISEGLFHILAENGVDLSILIK